MLYAVTLLIGVVAGLRAMTALAAVSWAAWGNVLPLGGSLLAFLGARWTPWVVTLLALGEMVTDQLPKTPSRKVPMQFITRLLVGAVCGGRPWRYRPPARRWGRHSALSARLSARWAAPPCGRALPQPLAVIYRRP